MNSKLCEGSEVGMSEAFVGCGGTGCKQYIGIGRLMIARCYASRGVGTVIMNDARDLPRYFPV